MGTITAGGTRTEREGMIACLVNDARALSLRGAMRATMQVLNRVYGVKEKRSFKRKLVESIVLSTAVTFMLLLAAAVVKVGPDTAKDVFGGGPVVSVLSFLASWGMSVALLFL